MQSKTNKLRGQLASVALEREQFEKQKRELEAQMNKGKNNMEKINKGIKGNEINGVLAELEVDESGSPRMIPKSAKHSFQPQNAAGRMMRGASSASSASPIKERMIGTANANGVSGNMTRTGTTYVIMDAAKIQAMRQSVIVPTFSRVSDWCFTGPIDSSPPIVKNNDIYEFVRWLGRGSFGDVQMVKSVDEKQLYAMKTIFSEHESEMQKSLREVMFLRTYRHPYIIDILDSFLTQQPKILHIVMHYCEGGDLGKLIIAAKKNSTSLNEHQIIKWSIQMALALHFLHENHILHRDLKPSNALLTDGGETVKLADFGLTIELENNKCTHATEAGTPLYTAPEMINGEQYSYPTDCWSFGVTLHELMRLDPPFYKSDTTELVKSILIDPPPELPSHYSAELRLICKLFLSKTPGNRLGFAAMLCDPFFASKLQSFPSTYRPKSLEERIRRAHVKQMQAQIDNMLCSQLSSSTPVPELLRLLEEEREAQAAAAAALAEAQALAAAEAAEAEAESLGGRSRNSLALSKKSSMRKAPELSSNSSGKLSTASSDATVGAVDGLLSAMAVSVEVERECDSDEDGENNGSSSCGSSVNGDNKSIVEPQKPQPLSTLETIAEPAQGECISPAAAIATTLLLGSEETRDATRTEDEVGSETENSHNGFSSCSNDDGDVSGEAASELEPRLIRQISGGRIGQAIAEAQDMDQELSKALSVPDAHQKQLLQSEQQQQLIEESAQL